MVFFCSGEAKIKVTFLPILVILGIGVTVMGNYLISG